MIRLLLLHKYSLFFKRTYVHVSFTCVLFSTFERGIAASRINYYNKYGLTRMKLASKVYIADASPRNSSHLSARYLVFNTAISLASFALRGARVRRVSLEIHRPRVEQLPFVAPRKLVVRARVESNGQNIARCIET